MFSYYTKRIQLYDNIPQEIWPNIDWYKPGTKLRTDQILGTPKCNLASQ